MIINAIIISEKVLNTHPKNHSFIVNLKVRTARPVSPSHRRYASAELQ